MASYDANTGNPGEATALDSPSVAIMDQFRRNRQMQDAQLAKQQQQEALEAARQTKLDQQNNRVQAGQTMAGDATQWATTPAYAGKSFAQAPAEAQQHFMSAYPDVAAQAPEAWNAAQRNVTGKPDIGLENLQEGQTAQVDMNGTKIAINHPPKYHYFPDPVTGQMMQHDPQTGEVTALQAQPAASDLGASPATGEAALAQMHPNDAAFVKALSEGRASLNNITTRGGQRQRVFALAQQYDPTVDETSLKTRQDTRKDFTSGTAANALRSGNAAIGHLKELSDSIPALNNSNVAPINEARNWFVRNTSDNPSQARFNTAKTILADELSKFFGGKGGTTVQSVKEWADQLNPADPPRVIKQHIDEVVNLLASQMQSYRGQYEAGMGKPKDINFLQPQSRAILRQLGHNPDEIENGTGAQVASVAPISAAPAQPSPQGPEVVTNGVAPATATPQFKTADDVKAAYSAGTLPREQAIQILKTQFGHAD